MIMISTVEGLAAFMMYLLGGALVLFIYEAYVKTKQKNLMFMALGFFLIIFGSNLNTLLAALAELPNSPILIDETMSRTISLVIQLGGILTVLYSALNPYGK
jgi:hypothetical protein